MNDEQRRWLTDLNESLWPKGFAARGIRLEAFRQLEPFELTKVEELIIENKLVTNMFSTNMFGGYGMEVYEQEPFPGTGPILLLTLIEDHLPGYERKPSLGVGNSLAWECFSKHTHSEKNREWLKSYNMDPPRERSYYDY